MAWSNHCLSFENVSGLHITLQGTLILFDSFVIEIILISIHVLPFTLEFKWSTDSQIKQTKQTSQNGQSKQVILFCQDNQVVVSPWTN